MSYIITLDEYFGDMPSHYPEDYNEEIENNAAELLSRVNDLIARVPEHYWSFHGINSAWRPKSYNDTIPKASKTSHHIWARAIDLTDRENNLDDTLFTHQGILQTCGLYMEWPADTPGWCHLQSVAPRSGRQVFRP